MSKVKETRMTLDFAHLRAEFEAAGLIPPGSGMEEMKHIVRHGQEIACELFDALNNYVIRRIDNDKCVHVEAYMLGAAFLINRLLPQMLGADSGLPSPEVCLDLVSKFKEVASSTVVVDKDDDEHGNPDAYEPVSDDDDDDGGNTPQIH